MVKIYSQRGNQVECEFISDFENEMVVMKLRINP